MRASFLSHKLKGATSFSVPAYKLTKKGCDLTVNVQQIALAIARFARILDGSEIEPERKLQIPLASADAATFRGDSSEG